MKFTKRMITRQQLLSQLWGLEYTVFEEPMIYSIKYRLGNRSHYGCYYRNKRHATMMRCHFQPYLSSKSPVVLIVRFYVSPPAHVEISSEKLKAEKTPATHAWELADFLLSFMEMLQKTLVSSYRQLVKIDMEKYYSATPRTVFKFTHWDHYVKGNKAAHSVHPKGKGKRAPKSKGLVQSELQGDGGDHAVGESAAG